MPCRHMCTIFQLILHKEGKGRLHSCVIVSARVLLKNLALPVILVINMGQSTSKVYLEGFCDKQYEPVKQKVQEMLDHGAEENLQLCVYVDGKCVIDLRSVCIA